MRLEMTNDYTGDDLLLRISFRTHEYVKSKTKELTKLRGLASPDELPRLSRPQLAPAYGNELPPYQRRRLPLTSRASPGTSAFAKDYARVVHSQSFRRLQGKTQLIPSGENEFFRTRLTHSLEVGEIAVRIAKKLNSKEFAEFPIDLDLVMSASLLHDIGHPPFGHSGEQTLNALMQNYGGFEGNAQTLRIVTCLENRLGRNSGIQDAIDSPAGLNLTAGTLASILKYDKEVTAGQTGPQIDLKKGYYSSERGIIEWLRQQLGVLDSLFTIECQIMDMADDIAYSAYDLEDTLEAGIVAPFDLMALPDEMLFSLTERVKKGLEKRDLSTELQPHIILKSLAHVFDNLLVFAEQGDASYDLNNRANDLLVFVGRTYLESLNHAKNPLVRRQFLETLIQTNIDSLTVTVDKKCPMLSKLNLNYDSVVTIESLKALNFYKVINSRRLSMQHSRNTKIISGLFEAFKEDKDGNLLSEPFRQMLESIKASDRDNAQKEISRMRLVSDFVSGLTDAEAINLYDQMYSTRSGHFWNYWR